MLTKQQVKNRMKWVKFLYDPAFKKGQSRMVQSFGDGTEGYCCLMKGCMVMNENAVKIAKSYHPDDGPYLPEDVSEFDNFNNFFGIDAEDCEYLSYYNDINGYSHEDIGMMIHLDTLYRLDSNDN